MKFYYSPVSTTCRIIMMLAEEEGIELDYHALDLMKGEQHAPEFKAINPNALVPALDDDGFVLCESGAIVRYLADKVGSTAYPRELKERARVDEAVEWFYSNFYKDHGYGLVYPQLFPHHRRPGEAAQEGAVAWGREKGRHWLGILDRDMLGPDRQFICGDTVTLADYVGAELVSLGELVHCTYEDYPNVRRWLANMKALKSWAKVHEAFDGFAASLADRHFVSI